MTEYYKLEVILPVHNHEEILEDNTLTVRDFLLQNNFRFIISIVDSGSNDCSYQIAKRLEEKYSDIFAYRLKEKGRGRVLKFRILNSLANFVGYMDVDLSTELSDFLEMYKQIQNGYDIVIGSRLLKDSYVERSLIRNFLSQTYSKLVRHFLVMPFLDYQCGFKLFNKDRILPLLPLIKNNNWFFDTELIFYAYRKKLQIKEIPVQWRESKKSTLKIIPAIIEHIYGIMRLKINSVLSYFL